MNFMDSDIHLCDLTAERMHIERQQRRYRVNWQGVIGLGLICLSAAGVIAFVWWLI